MKRTVKEVIQEQLRLARQQKQAGHLKYWQAVEDRVLCRGENFDIATRVEAIARLIIDPTRFRLKPLDK